MPHEVGDGGHVDALVERPRGKRPSQHVRREAPDPGLLAAQFDAARYGPAGCPAAIVAALRRLERTAGRAASDCAAT